MGTVCYLRIEIKLDRWGRVIPTPGQRWVEKLDPTSVWVIRRIELLRIDNEEEKLIHLRAFEDGAECESVYTEKYFRKWFYEINQPQRRKNRIRPAKPTIPSLKKLIITGLFVGK